MKATATMAITSPIKRNLRGGIRTTRAMAPISSPMNAPVRFFVTPRKIPVGIRRMKNISGRFVLLSRNVESIVVAVKVIVVVAETVPLTVLVRVVVLMATLKMEWIYMKCLGVWTVLEKKEGGGIDEPTA